MNPTLVLLTALILAPLAAPNAADAPARGANKGVRSLCLVNCVLEVARVAAKSIPDRVDVRLIPPMFRFQMDSLV